METMTLKAEPRKEVGTRASRRLRERGMLPAVVYGHNEPAESVVLSEHDVEVALLHGARMITLDLNGAGKQYLIKEVQYDHLGHKPIHLDLTRVDLHERVQVKVGIELRGVPKGVSDGGILDQVMADLEIECLVTEIPETLHPLVTGLEINDSLLVKDLPLPSGVVPLEEPDAVVATVRPPVEEPEEEEAPVEGEEAAAEPERIGRARKEEGGEEES